MWIRVYYSQKHAKVAFSIDFVPSMVEIHPSLRPQSIYTFECLVSQNFPGRICVKAFGWIILHLKCV